MTRYIFVNILATEECNVSNCISSVVVIDETTTKISILILAHFKIKFYWGSVFYKFSYGQNHDHIDHQMVTLSIKLVYSWFQSGNQPTK